MPKQSWQPEPESEDVLLKNLAWAQAAWLAKKARQAGESIGEASQEKLFEWMGKWREDNVDAKTAAESYPFPKGLLNAGWAGQHGPGINSEDFRRSLAAYEERTGKKATARSVDGFRAAAKPLVEWARRDQRVFSEKLLDLVAASGGEHSVIFTPGRVLKVTELDSAGSSIRFREDGEPGVFHATLPEYVRQIEDGNRLANQDVRIEGVMRGKDGSIRIVTSQGAVHGVEPTTKEAEAKFMENGYLPIDKENMLGRAGHEAWWHPETNTAIWDAKSDNLVKTNKGEIVMIDVKVFQPGGKALEWMKAHAIWT